MQSIPGINADIVKRFAPNPGRKPLLPPLSEQALRTVAVTVRTSVSVADRAGWENAVTARAATRRQRLRSMITQMTCMF